MGISVLGSATKLGLLFPKGIFGLARETVKGVSNLISLVAVNRLWILAVLILLIGVTTNRYGAKVYNKGEFVWRCKIQPFLQQVSPITTAVDTLASFEHQCLINMPGWAYKLLRKSVIKKILFSCVPDINIVFDTIANIAVGIVDLILNILVWITDLLYNITVWISDVGTETQTYPSVYGALKNLFFAIAVNARSGVACLCEPVEVIGEIIYNILEDDHILCAAQQIINAAFQLANDYLGYIVEIAISLLTFEFDRSIIELNAPNHLLTAEKLTIGAAHIVEFAKSNVVANLICTLIGISKGTGEDDVEVPNSFAQQCAVTCDGNCALSCIASRAPGQTFQQCVAACITDCRDDCFSVFIDAEELQCRIDAEPYLELLDIVTPAAGAILRAAAALLDAIVRVPIWTSGGYDYAYNGFLSNLERAYDSLRSPDYYYDYETYQWIHCNESLYCHPSSLPTDAAIESAFVNESGNPLGNCSDRTCSSQDYTCSQCAGITINIPLDRSVCYWGELLDDALHDLGFPDDQNIGRLIFCGYVGSYLRLVVEVTRYAIAALFHSFDDGLGFLYYVGYEQNAEPLLQALRWAADWIGQTIPELIGPEFGDDPALVVRSFFKVYPIEALWFVFQLGTRFLNQFMEWVTGDNFFVSEERYYLDHFFCVDNDYCGSRTIDRMASYLMQPRQAVTSDDLNGNYPIQTSEPKGLLDGLRSMINFDEALRELGYDIPLPDLGCTPYYVGRIIVDIVVILSRFILNFQDVFDYIRCEGATECAPIVWIIRDIDAFIQECPCALFGTDGSYDDQIPIPCVCATTGTIAGAVKVILEELVRALRITLDIIRSDTDELFDDVIEIIDTAYAEFDMDYIKAYINTLNDIKFLLTVLAPDLSEDQLQERLDNYLRKLVSTRNLLVDLGNAAGCFASIFLNFFEPQAGPYSSFQDILTDIAYDIVIFLSTIIRAALKLFREFVIMARDNVVTLNGLTNIVVGILKDILYALAGDYSPMPNARQGLIQHVGWLGTALLGFRGCKSYCSTSAFPPPLPRPYTAGGPVCLFDPLVCLGNIIAKIGVGITRIVSGTLNLLLIITGSNTNMINALGDIFGGIATILRAILRDLVNFIIDAIEAMLASIWSVLGDMWHVLMYVVRPALEVLSWLLSFFGDSKVNALYDSYLDDVYGLNYYLEPNNRVTKTLISYTDGRVVAEPDSSSPPPLGTTQWRVELAHEIFYGDSVCAETILSVAHETAESGKSHSYADRALIRACLYAAAAAVKVGVAPHEFYDMGSLVHVMMDFAGSFDMFVDWESYEGLIPAAELLTRSEARPFTASNLHSAFAHTNISHAESSALHADILAKQIKFIKVNTADQFALLTGMRSQYARQAFKNMHGEFRRRQPYLFEDYEYATYQIPFNDTIARENFYNHSSNFATRWDRSTDYVLQLTRSKLEEYEIKYGKSPSLQSIQEDVGYAANLVNQYSKLLWNVTTYLLWPDTATDESMRKKNPDRVLEALPRYETTKQALEAVRKENRSDSILGKISHAVRYKWHQIMHKITTRNAERKHALLKLRDYALKPKTISAFRRRRSAQKFIRSVARFVQESKVAPIAPNLARAAQYVEHSMMEVPPLEALLAAGVSPAEAHRILEQAAAEDEAVRLPSTGDVLGATIIPIPDETGCALIDDTVIEFLEQLNFCLEGSAKPYFNAPHPLFEWVPYDDTDAENNTFASYFRNPMLIFNQLTGGDWPRMLLNFFSNTNEKAVDGPVGFLSEFRNLPVPYLSFVFKCDAEAATRCLHGYGFYGALWRTAFYWGCNVGAALMGWPTFPFTITSFSGLFNPVNWWVMGNIFTRLAYNYPLHCLDKMFVPECALEEGGTVLSDFINANITVTRKFTNNDYIPTLETCWADLPSEERFVDLIDYDNCTTTFGMSSPTAPIGYMMFSSKARSLYNKLYTVVPWLVGGEEFNLATRTLDLSNPDVVDQFSHCQKMALGEFIGWFAVVFLMTLGTAIVVSGVIFFLIGWMTELLMLVGMITFGPLFNKVADDMSGDSRTMTEQDVIEVMNRPTLFVEEGVPITETQPQARVNAFMQRYNNVVSKHQSNVFTDPGFGLDEHSLGWDNSTHEDEYNPLYRTASSSRQMIGAELRQAAALVGDGIQYVVGASPDGVQWVVFKTPFIGSWMRTKLDKRRRKKQMLTIKKTK